MASYVQRAKNWVQAAYQPTISDAQGNITKNAVVEVKLGLYAGVAGCLLAKYAFAGINPILGGTIAAVHYLAIPILKKLLQDRQFPESSAYATALLLSTWTPILAFSRMLPLIQVVSFIGCTRLIAVTALSTPSVLRALFNWARSQ